jgi:hypothetical protein
MFAAIPAYAPTTIPALTPASTEEEKKARLDLIQYEIGQLMRLSKSSGVNLGIEPVYKKDPLDEGRAAKAPKHSNGQDASSSSTRRIHTLAVDAHPDAVISPFPNLLFVIGETARGRNEVWLAKINQPVARPELESKLSITWMEEHAFSENTQQHLYHFSKLENGDLWTQDIEIQEVVCYVYGPQDIAAVHVTAKAVEFVKNMAFH